MGETGTAGLQLFRVHEKQIPHPSSPCPTSIPCCCLGVVVPPLESLLLSLLSLVFLSPDYLLSLREWETFHITSQTIPAKRVGHGATPSFFSNQVSE